MGHYYINAKNQNHILNIDSIGTSDDIKITRFGPGCRNHYIIHYVISGKGYYNNNPVNQGQGFLIYPGQDEVYFPDNDDPWTFLWVMSKDAKMHELFGKYNSNPKTLIFDYGDVSVAEKTTEKLSLAPSPMADSLVLTEMFLHLFNSHTLNTGIRSKPNSEIYLDFAVNYIDNNIHLPITVNTLTELLGVSQPYLYKIFSEKFGVSPKQYITGKRLKLSKKLLSETDLPVSGIANSTGFGDVLSFSKFFKSKTTLSPSSYRRISTPDPSYSPTKPD